nr:hypothetical protein B0A51_05184 [Rachicladosporium sp. CCFEE 5018]OQO26796.1 hypothetical protein B0A51_04379 [Rachicladosporium sp. CCFEE 5018]
MLYVTQSDSDCSSPACHEDKGFSQDVKTPLPEKAPLVDPYSVIVPLLDFDWRSTPPVKIRPFKPMYYLTMALENMPLSELIEIDNTFLDRLALRRQITTQNPQETVACNRIATPAARELYSWMLGTYLPTRFPTMYEVRDGSLYSKATNETLPLRSGSGMGALTALTANVDTDFLILLPRTTPEGADIYHLEAFATCFPSGFSTFSKLGLPLADIHGPVPGYKDKLEKSMDRFFARLEKGRCVKRTNWQVTTNDVLFATVGNHMHVSSPEEAESEIELQRLRDEVVIDDCRLRCERQTLHRLPETGALVFAFKTYLYTLQEVKDEGLGEVLAEAIDGLGKGSVAGMEVYKRGVVWGEKVKKFLSS